MILTERLYLTEDRKSVVREGDKRAAYLLGVAGTVIPEALAKRLGILPIQETLVNAVVNRDPEIISRDPEPKRRGRWPKH